MDKKDSNFRYPSWLILDTLRLIGYIISKVLWFVTYKDKQNLPPGDSTAYVVIANHQTYIDPVWVCLPIRRRIRFMAFGDAFEWRFVGKFIRYLGAFPVSTTPAGKVSAIKESLKTIRDGAVLMIFPEGEREFADGELLEFKTGAVKIAAQARVPVLPVTISGGNRIWPQKQRYPNIFRRVTITYHPIVDLGDVRNEDEIEEWTEKLRSIIGGTELQLSSSSGAE